MFEKIKMDIQRSKDEKVRKQIESAFSITEKNGEIFITHLGEAIKNVTDMNTQEILNLLKSMREECVAWNLLMGS